MVAGCASNPVEAADTISLTPVSLSLRDTDCKPYVDAGGATLRYLANQQGYLQVDVRSSLKGVAFDQKSLFQQIFKAAVYSDVKAAVLNANLTIGSNTLVVPLYAFDQSTGKSVDYGDRRVFLGKVNATDNVQVIFGIQYTDQPHASIIETIQGIIGVLPVLNTISGGAALSSNLVTEAAKINLAKSQSTLDNALAQSANLSVEREIDITPIISHCQGATYGWGVKMNATQDGKPLPVEYDIVVSFLPSVINPTVPLTNGEPDYSGLGNSYPNYFIENVTVLKQNYTTIFDPAVLPWVRNRPPVWPAPA